MAKAMKAAEIRIRTYQTAEQITALPQDSHEALHSFACRSKLPVGHSKWHKVRTGPSVSVRASMRHCILGSLDSTHKPNGLSLRVQGCST